MTAEVWKPGNVYLRVHPKKGERAFVSAHRCWNTDLFIDAQRRAYFDAGGVIEVISETEYRKEGGR